MTRIDLIPVEELSDKHLLSNYRELPRVSALAWRWYGRISPLVDEDICEDYMRWYSIPDTYRLGTGHVKFFYDKGEWLRKRFEEELVPEMRKRGFKTNFTTYRMHPEGLNESWIPDEEALSINRERIEKRLKGDKT